MHARETKALVLAGLVVASGATAHQSGITTQEPRTSRGFVIHSAESAPATSKPILEGIQAAFGFVPNMNATLAESPVLLKGAGALGQALNDAELSAVERNLVSIAAAREYGNVYCVSGHCTMASTALGRDAAELDALRSGKPLADSRLEALRVFTSRMVATQGAISDAEFEAFLSAGFTRRHMLEVVALIAEKTISTQVRNLAQVPVDAAFEAQRWDGKK